MILSVSRRTDIPNYYADWFYNRVKEGFVYVRNPMNPHQVSKIVISPETVDCMVFWTKNPGPMIGRLEELNAYDYYFQFTLTGYGKDIERNVPHKKEIMIPIFQELAEKIGKKKVVWRYDPILFTKVYTPEYHMKAFEQIAEALRGYTERCVISFVDVYARNQRNLKAAGAYDLDLSALREFCKTVCGIAGKNEMTVGSCAERMDLEDCGIEHNCCIDKKIIENITGCEIKAGKDKNQRPECGCLESVDIGTYHTCKNGCLYCYANDSQESVMKNSGRYDMDSPLLCSALTKEDRVTERNVTSFKVRQISLFDA